MSYLITSWCYDSKKIAESSLDMVGSKDLRGWGGAKFLYLDGNKNDMKMKSAEGGQRGHQFRYNS